jgi:transposase InsO family protein
LGRRNDDAEVTVRRRRRVVAKYPGHVWHVDLTTVPTRAGSWVPWFPFSAPQRRPFCWCVAVPVDPFSLAAVGFAVFARLPTSKQVQSFRDRAVRASRSTPKYVITDKGKQPWCRSFKSWCKRRGIRPRVGAIGQPACIAIVERFIRSMNQDCTRCVLVPMSLAAMRLELSVYATWYNTERPHMKLAGATPREVFANRKVRRQRFETRRRWPHDPRCSKVGGDKVRPAVNCIEGRTHLPGLHRQSRRDRRVLTLESPAIARFCV